MKWTAGMTGLLAASLSATPTLAQRIPTPTDVAATVAMARGFQQAMQQAVPDATFEAMQCSRADTATSATRSRP